MYIRMLSFQTNGNKKAEAISIMNNVIPGIKSQNGCRDCMFIMHESDDLYALLVFWESRQDADNAAQMIGPRMIPALNRISKEVVVPRLYEAYQAEPAVI